MLDLVIIKLNDKLHLRDIAYTFNESDELIKYYNSEIKVLLDLLYEYNSSSDIEIVEREFVINLYGLEIKSKTYGYKEK